MIALLADIGQRTENVYEGGLCLIAFVVFVVVRHR